MGSWEECSASDAVGLGTTCVSHLGRFRFRFRTLGCWDCGAEGWDGEVVRTLWYGLGALGVQAG